MPENSTTDTALQISADVNMDAAMNAAGPEVVAWVNGLPSRLAQALGGHVDVTIQPPLTRPVLRLRVCVAHLNVVLDYEIDHYLLRIAVNQQALEVETVRLINRMKAFLHKEKLAEA